VDDGFLEKMNAEERKSALSDSQRTSFGSNHSSPYPASEVDDLQPQPTSVVASVGSKPPESTEISGRKRQTSPYFRKATPKRRPVAHHRRPKKLPLEAINALSTWLSLQEPQNAPSTNDLQYLSRVTGLKPKRVARCLEDICSQYRSPLESYLMSSSEDGGASVGDIERELERRQIGVNHSSTLETTTLQSTTEAFKAMKDGFIFPSYLADERTTTTFKPYWSTLENQLLSNDLMVFPRSQLNFDLASGGPAGIDYLTPPLLAHGCGIPDEPLGWTETIQPSVSASTRTFSLEQKPDGPSTLWLPPDEDQSAAPPQNQQVPEWTKRTGRHTFQCTFCRVPLTEGAWKRHEESQHLPRRKWTCLLTGPYVQQGCALCEEDLPNHNPYDHLKVTECIIRDPEERSFLRKDGLTQHVINFHGVAQLRHDVVAEWEVPAEQGEQDWVCGFCGETLRGWDARAAHLAVHFRQGMTMESWRDVNNTMPIQPI